MRDLIVTARGGMSLAGELMPGVEFKAGDLLTFMWDNGTTQTAAILHTDPHWVNGASEICMDWMDNGTPVWSEVHRIIGWEAGNGAE